MTRATDRGSGNGGGETPGLAVRVAARVIDIALVAALGAVPFAGPILALAAWIWIVLAIRSSPLGQGPHDHLAGGTRVVHAGRTPV